MRPSNISKAVDYDPAIDAMLELLEVAAKMS